MLRAGAELVLPGTTCPRKIGSKKLDIHRSVVVSSHTMASHVGNRRGESEAFRRLHSMRRAHCSHFEQQALFSMRQDALPSVLRERECHRYFAQSLRYLLHQKGRQYERITAASVTRWRREKRNSFSCFTDAANGRM